MSKPKSAPLTPLVEDSSQPSYVRELLRAGRDASLGGVAGYDFESGLAKHLAHVEAGTPMPDWAKGLQPSGAAAGASAASSASVLTWMGVPLAVGAAVAAAVWIARPAQAPQAAPVWHPVPVATEGPAASALRVLPTAPEQGARVEPGAPDGQVSGSPVGSSSATATSSKGAARTHTKLGAGASKSVSSKTAVETVDARGSAVATISGEGTSVARASDAPHVAASQPSGDLFQKAQPARVEQPVAAAEPESPAKNEEARAQRPAPVDDNRLEREMEMLAMAQRVLLGDPERALRLTRQGEAEFRGSMFTEERQQLLLLSLVKLGRLDEAKAAAKPYLARYPHGPFSDRVRQALATGRVER